MAIQSLDDQISVEKLQLEFKNNEDDTKKYKKYICPVKLQETYFEKMKSLDEESFKMIRE